MKKTLTYVGGLIALYLLVNYASGTKDVINSAATGGTGIIKALQGRG